MTAGIYPHFPWEVPGFTLASGRPFVSVKRSGHKPRGNRTPHIQALSKAFHNWFYAGWVAVQNEWATIAPKTVKGEWEAMVSTEDFERGLAILARRRQIPMPVKKHFYLLQGLVYLELYFGQVHKLVCSKPNAKRSQDGASYYCIPSSNQNYLCSEIDEQIESHMRAIQISPELLPKIRKVYMADIARYTRDSAQERKTLETRIKKLEEKELNLWRAFTDHGMRPNIYETLTRECQEERARLDAMSKGLKEEEADHVTNLDAALSVISQIGERWISPKCTVEQQRAILLQMVERVVINRAGRIKHIEWKSPFCYLALIAGSPNGTPKSTAKKQKNAGLVAFLARSLHIAPLAPGGYRAILRDSLHTAISLFKSLLYPLPRAEALPASAKIPPNVERNQDIYSRYLAGERAQKLANEFDISVRSVNWLITRFRHNVV